MEVEETEAVAEGGVTTTDDDGNEVEDAAENATARPSGKLCNRSERNRRIVSRHEDCLVVGWICSIRLFVLASLGLFSCVDVSLMREVGCVDDKASSFLNESIEVFSSKTVDDSNDDLGNEDEK